MIISAGRRTHRISNKIVFLTGKQRAGKDTVADLLVEHFGFTKLSLADKVKDIAIDLFGMGDKDRGLLIQIGTGMRAIREDVWIDFLLSRPIPNTPIVIPDVRFPNEFNKLKDLGALAVHVDAPVDVRQYREGYDAEYENNATEEYLLDYEHDFRVVNDGTLTELFMKVYQLGIMVLDLDG